MDYGEEKRAAVPAYAAEEARGRSAVRDVAKVRETKEKRMSIEGARRYPDFNEWLRDSLQEHSPWFMPPRRYGTGELVDSPHEDQMEVIRERLNGFFQAKSLEDRKIEARSVINALWVLYGQTKYFSKSLEELIKWERERFLKDKIYRDHVSHTLYVFLLGHYFIYNSGCDPRGLLWSTLVRPFFGSIDTTLRGYLDKSYSCLWLLTSTLHDICYPRQYNPVEDEDQLEATLKPVVEYIRGKNGFVDFPGVRELISAGGAEDDIHLRHALASSIYAIEKFTKKTGAPSFNEVQDNVKEAILIIASAILLHDYTGSKKGQIKMPLNEDTSVAYLLVLADEIQEWDRESTGQTVVNPDDILITYKKEAGKEVIRCGLPYGAHAIREKNEKIRAKLEMTDVDIEFEELP